MLVQFPLQDVLELVDWNKKHTQAPSYDEMFDPKYYPGGKLINDERGWPDTTKIVTEKLPRCLHLVKDEGLYLMAGTQERLPAKEPHDTRHHVVFAEGYNPDRDAGWWEAARDAFGGDDGAVSIPLEWVDITLRENPGTQHFCLDVSPEKIGLAIEVTKPQRKPSEPGGPGL